MFYCYEHFMSISHIALIVNMVHMIIWCQNLRISFMVWFTTGLPWFHGDDQRSGWEQLEIYFGAACSGDRRRERKNTRPPENKKQGKETKNKKNKFGTPQKEKGEKSNTEKRRKTAQPQKKKEKKKRRREKKRKKRKREVKLLNSKKKRHEEKNKKLFAHLRLSEFNLRIEFEWLRIVLEIILKFKKNRW